MDEKLTSLRQDSKISCLEFHIVKKKHNKTRFIETFQGSKRTKPEIQICYKSNWNSKYAYHNKPTKLRTYQSDDFFALNLVWTQVCTSLICFLYFAFFRFLIFFSLLYASLCCGVRDSLLHQYVLIDSVCNGGCVCCSMNISFLCVELISQCVIK